MTDLDDTRRLDRAERLIRKNAVLLGEHVRIGVRLLPDGRVRLSYLPGIRRTRLETAKPYIYASVEDAYQAALRAHVRAHVEHLRRAYVLAVPGADTQLLREHLQVAGVSR